MRAFEEITGRGGIDRIQMAFNERTGEFKNLAYVITTNKQSYDKILNRGSKIPFFDSFIYIESSLPAQRIQNQTSSPSKDIFPS